MDMSLSKLWETVKDREAVMQLSMGSQRVGHDSATEHQQLSKNYPHLPSLRLEIPLCLCPEPFVAVITEAGPFFLWSFLHCVLC